MVTPPLPPSSTPRLERRQFPRYNVALDAAFGPLLGPEALPSQEQLERTVTVNVGLGGVCLYSDILYPIGTHLYCAITVPGRRQPIETRGVVAWFQKIEREAHGYRVGLEFRELRREDAAAIEALLAHPPAAAASRSKRLLLVDDDEQLRLALKLRFEASGFQVSTAADGLEALRKGREERPDLIILDLMLPQMNGYEVCRLLKFDQKFRHIPILIFTARCRSEDRDMGLAAGADAYITKPFSGQDLLVRVDELLSSPHP